MVVVVGVIACRLYKYIVGICMYRQWWWRRQDNSIHYCVYSTVGHTQHTNRSTKWRWHAIIARLVSRTRKAYCCVYRRRIGYGRQHRHNINGRVYCRLGASIAVSARSTIHVRASLLYCLRLNIAVWQFSHIFIVKLVVVMIAVCVCVLFGK